MDILVIRCHVCVGYAGVVRVEVSYEEQCGIWGLPCACVLECEQVSVIKDRDQMVFGGGIYHPALLVYAALLLVFLDEALLLPGQRPFWEGFCYSQVWRLEEGGIRNLIVLLGQKYKPEVPVLPSAKATLIRCRVCRQELMNLFGWRIIGISRVLVEWGGRKPLGGGVNQWCGQHNFNAYWWGYQDLSRC